MSRIMEPDHHDRRDKTQREHRREHIDQHLRIVRVDRVVDQHFQQQREGRVVEGLDQDRHADQADALLVGRKERLEEIPGDLQRIARLLRIQHVRRALILVVVVFVLVIVLFGVFLFLLFGRGLRLRLGRTPALQRLIVDGSCFFRLFCHESPGNAGRAGESRLSCTRVGPA
jgi:hypothetical protein